MLFYFTAVAAFLQPNIFKSTKGILNKVKRALSSQIDVKSIYAEPGIYVGGDFEELVKKSSIFVDKSLFIKEIIENTNKVSLITMPRRWGKSLNLDMLKRFLSVEVDTKTGSIIPNTQTVNYKLFAGGNLDLGFGSIKNAEKLKIASDDYCMRHQGQFPVIFIDFQDCVRMSGFANIEEAVRNKIIKLFIDFGYLQTSNTIYSGTMTIVDRYDMLLQDIRTKKKFTHGIKDLSELLRKHHHQKVWILIDEYDAAANEAYRRFDDAEAQQVVGLFREILGTSLKGNDALFKGVITGVQCMVKSGPLSDANNIIKYSIQNYQYSQYYGVNQEEMDILFSHFNVNDDRRDKTKDWYDGYQEKVTSTGEIINKYNIWSVVQCLNNPERGFRAYWEETGSIDFIKNLLKKKGMLDKINSLVDGESITLLSLNIDFCVQDFKTLKEIISLDGNKEISDYGVDVLFSYLFITGYLTEDVDNIKKYKFPNEEIKYAFGKRVIEHYQAIYAVDCDKLADLTDILHKLVDKNQSTKYDNKQRIRFIKKSFISQFQPKFNELIKECRLADDNDSTDGIFANEDSMHSLLNYIGMQVRNILFGCEIYTKKILSDKKGRVDMVVKNKETGIIIELKYDGKAQDALTQAKTYENLISCQQEKIFIGVDISTSKEVSLAGEIHTAGDEIYNFSDSERDE